MNDSAPTNVSTDGVRIRGDGYFAEAGWFGPDDRPRFGWLYRPDAAAATGIVIVPPFGREDICAHRTLRHLAEDAARAGFVAVRFDLDGTGDSAGGDTDPDRVASWVSSIHGACDLARGAGVVQVALVGVRLGATLAALAASQRRDIAALVAFNAVISGKAYLRELRAFQAAMNLQPPPDPVAASGQETSGFLFTDETCEALKKIDLATSDAVPAPKLRLIERDDMPERGNWPERLRSLGVDVTEQRVPGYPAMMNDPHASRVPQVFIDDCIDFVRQLPPTDTGVPLTTKVQSLRPRIVQSIDGSAVVEQVVAPGPGMFGILAAPASGNPDRAVLMLNAGAIRRIGSNRIDVPLARQLAATGLAILRADMSGIGDSQPRVGQSENVVYGPHTLDDVGVMVSWLRAYGARELAAGGMCSGAYHALRAAIAGQAIDRAYMVNCGVFAPTVRFDPEVAGLYGTIAHYNRSIKSSRSWHKLLRGQVAFGTILHVLAWQLRLRGKRALKELARRMHLPLRNDLGSDLQAMARRGARADFLFSANEAGRTLLATEAGSVVPRLCAAGKFSMRILEGTDHTFTQRWAQALLGEALKAILIPPARKTS